MIHKAETTPLDWTWAYTKIQKSTSLVQQDQWTQVVIIHLSRLRPAMNSDHTAFWKQKYYLLIVVRCLLSPKASHFWQPEQGCFLRFFPDSSSASVRFSWTTKSDLSTDHPLKTTTLCFFSCVCGTFLALVQRAEEEPLEPIELS